MEGQVFELSKFDSGTSFQEPLQLELELEPQKLVIKTQISKLCEHTSLMLKKNYIIMSRNKKTTFFQLFSPVLVCLLIVFWQYLANIITDYSEINPEITSTNLISKCVPPNYNKNCITIGYGIAVTLTNFIFN